MSAEPLVSVVMPVLDEARNLERGLPTLAAQSLGPDRFEVIVADGGSGDGTRDVLRAFGARLDIRVVDNSVRREAEWGKALAIEAARGRFIQCMDADMWLPSPDLLEALTVPLARDSALAGAIAPYVFDRSLSLWSRYLSCDAFQRDPLYQVLTPGIDDFRVERCAGYDVCHFPSSRIPPFGGTTMYRREEIDLSRWRGFFNELDHAAHLVDRGRDRFAYVSDLGWAHDHCSGLANLVRKRRRNLLHMSNGYLRDVSRRDFVWLDTTDRREVLRLLAFLVGAHLVVPETVRGLCDAVRTRHWEAALRPIAALALTDVVLISVLGVGDGRQLVRAALRGRPARPGSCPGA